MSIWIIIPLLLLVIFVLAVAAANHDEKLHRQKKQEPETPD